MVVESSATLSWKANLTPEEAEEMLDRLRKAFPHLIIQVFGWDGAPSLKMFEMIGAQTARACSSGDALAEKPELDLLLRLAGTTQIGEALRSAGYRSGSRRYLIAVGSDAELTRLGRRLTADARFDPLTGKSLEEGEADVVERAALLAARV